MRGICLVTAPRDMPAQATVSAPSSVATTCRTRGVVAGGQAGTAQAMTSVTTTDVRAPVRRGRVPAGALGTV